MEELKTNPKTRRKYLKWLDILQKQYELQGHVNNTWLLKNLKCSRSLRYYILKNYDIDYSPYISSKYTYTKKHKPIIDKILLGFDPTKNTSTNAKNMSVNYQLLKKVVSDYNLDNSQTKRENKKFQLLREEKFKLIAKHYDPKKSLYRLAADTKLSRITVNKYLKLMDLKKFK
jgi:hypothetical protein